MSNVINLALAQQTADEPMPAMRWVQRGDEKVLQQWWKTMRRSYVSYEWRDVPIEMEN